MRLCCRQGAHEVLCLGGDAAPLLQNTSLGSRQGLGFLGLGYSSPARQPNYGEVTGIAPRQQHTMLSCLDVTVVCSHGLHHAEFRACMQVLSIEFVAALHEKTRRGNDETALRELPATTS